VRKTPDELIKTQDQLLDSCTDHEAAIRLNDLGHRNWQGKVFTKKKVEFIRHAYGLASRFERLRARGLLTAPELAKQLKVSVTTIYTWGRQGLLQRELYGNTRRCLYERPRDRTIIKGQGGRQAKQPMLINAQSSAQEIV
jgi:hypothetical protein